MNEKNAEKRYNDPGVKGFLPGNPGRPKGSGDSVKAWLRRKLKDMPEEEKELFIAEVSKETQWKMAEGNPESDTNTKVTGELKVTFDEAFKDYDNSTPETEGDSSEQSTV